MSDQERRAATPADVTVVMDPNCQDIFVDGVIGATVRDGIVRMNLVNLRSTPDGRSQEHAVVGRLLLTHLMPFTDPAAMLAAARRTWAGPLEIVDCGATYEV